MRLVVNRCKDTRTKCTTINHQRTHRNPLRRQPRLYLASSLFIESRRSLNIAPRAPILIESHAAKSFLSDMRALFSRVATLKPCSSQATTRSHGSPGQTLCVRLSTRELHQRIEEKEDATTKKRPKPLTPSKTPNKQHTSKKKTKNSS